MKLRLEVNASDGVWYAVEHAGPAVRIGRAPGSEVRFDGEAARVVSWEHARIDLTPAGPVLCDLGSLNGTFVNGHRVGDRHPLSPGDAIQLGQAGPQLRVTVLAADKAAPSASINGAPPTAPQPLTPAMRRMLFAAALLVFLVGIQLFVLGEFTERFFAWKVDPPLTAAFLGAAYWASCLLELLSARERLWARARPAVPAVLIFTTLTLVVTLVHIDRFFMDSFRGWSWLAVYAIVPPLMFGLLIRQVGVPGADPPRRHPLRLWERGAFTGQSAVLLVLGLLFLIAPATTAPLWPWPLTPLTGRATGAWMVGIGVFLGHAALENAWERLRPGTTSMAVLGVLQVVALARYPSAVDWLRPSVWVYTAFLLGLLGMGVYGFFRAQQALRQDVPTP